MRNEKVVIASINKRFHNNCVTMTAKRSPVNKIANARLSIGPQSGLLSIAVRS